MEISPQSNEIIILNMKSPSIHCGKYISIRASIAPALSAVATDVQFPPFFGPAQSKT
jgi:hypothetical protein